jgi:NADH dehydrogenase (ubiquinone) Fe-S protein 2
MLEGAKSIGAGAATIALAGAAVGIGNGMPTKNQLISFANECNGVAYCLYFFFLIYFFFLSYFFPMTTRNGQIKNFTSNSGPQHPAAHGVSRSVLEMNGEVVERAEPHIGSLQCGTKPLTLSRLLCR